MTTAKKDGYIALVPPPSTSSPLSLPLSLFLTHSHALSPSCLINKHAQQRTIHV